MHPELRPHALALRDIVEGERRLCALLNDGAIFHTDREVGV
jgi:hypothetical protein